MQNTFKTGDRVRITGGNNITLFSDPVIVLSNLYDSRYQKVEEWYIVFYPDLTWQGNDRYQVVHGINLEHLTE